MKICITEVTDNRYKKEEYQKKWIVGMGGCYPDGHVMLNIGQHLLHITGKSKYRLGCLCLRKHQTGDWCNRLRGLSPKAQAQPV